MKQDYNIQDYYKDLKEIGLSKTWDMILNNVLYHDFKNELINIENFGELYEIGLAETNKISKKELGKYYTPLDVADIMSLLFLDIQGNNICDVGCGTGNLILSFLKLIGNEQAVALINEGRLFLYDIDELALKITQFSIAKIYGVNLLNRINIISGDFLDTNIKLPKDCKVISNPPYGKIKDAPKSWDQTDILLNTKDLYAVFMDKIISQSNAACIISPHSFMGSNKFISLRNKLNNYNGIIYSFDNVPGSIFNGRKHGIFNTNSSNSVRAAITVIENKDNIKGFKISPFIRFKTEERDSVLNIDYLKSLLDDSTEYQIITPKNSMYKKMFKETKVIFDTWFNNESIKDLLLNNKLNFQIDVPNTCRYYTVASTQNLNRTGKIILYPKSEEAFYLIYGLLNSSFAYMYYRVYNGGITFPKSLLTSMPKIILNEKQKSELKKVCDELIINESNYLIYKKNAGSIQTNIKFPIEYRDRINAIFIDALNIDLEIKMCYTFHSNNIKGTIDVLEENDEEEEDNE
jgi:predicted RNA methylase